MSNSTPVPPPYEVAGHFIRTARGADVSAIDGQLVAELDRRNPNHQATGAFIVEACNSHSRLNGDRISLEVQLGRLKMDHEEVSSRADAARKNWEVAVEAGADVTRQLEAAKLVQQQLVAALTMVRDADDDCAHDALPCIPAVARAVIDAALAAAGAA